MRSIIIYFLIETIKSGFVEIGLASAFVEGKNCMLCFCFFQSRKCGVRNLGMMFFSSNNFNQTINLNLIGVMRGNFCGASFSNCFLLGWLSISAEKINHSVDSETINANDFSQKLCSFVD